MTVNFEVFLTILGMALVTYATRIGGFWLVNRIKLSARVERGLQYLPGTVLVSLIAPEIGKGGLTTALASVATVLTGWRTKNLLVAMLVGVGLVYFLRSIVGMG